MITGLDYIYKINRTKTGYKFSPQMPSSFYAQFDYMFIKTADVVTGSTVTYGTSSSGLSIGFNIPSDNNSNKRFQLAFRYAGTNAWTRFSNWHFCAQDLVLWHHLYNSTYAIVTNKIIPDIVELKHFVRDHAYDIGVDLIQNSFSTLKIAKTVKTSNIAGPNVLKVKPKLYGATNGYCIEHEVDMLSKLEFSADTYTAGDIYGNNNYSTNGGVYCREATNDRYSNRAYMQYSASQLHNKEFAWLQLPSYHSDLAMTIEIYVYKSALDLSALTWNNQPAVSSMTLIGTADINTNNDEIYTIPLDVDELGSSIAGTNYTIMVKQAENQTTGFLRWYSNEATGSPKRAFLLYR